MSSRYKEIYAQYYWRGEHGPPGCHLCNVVPTLRHLWKVYGPCLKGMRCEECASVVIRSELHLRRADHPRFGRMIHLFEDLDRERHYVGAVLVRRPEARMFEEPEGGGRASIAEAFLAPPRHMRCGDYVLPTLGAYSSYIGLLPFECTPYTSQSRGWGTYCAEAAMFLCLVMLMDRGAIVHAPFTLTSLAPAEKDVEGLHPDDVEPHVEEDEAGRAFAIDGLTPNQILGILRDERVCDGGTYENVHWPEGISLPDMIQLTWLKLEPYLAARIPVMLAVNAWWLYGDADGSPPGDTDQETHTESHTIVVIGYSGHASGDALDLSLVYHDTYVLPYMERAARDLVKATATYVHPGVVKTARMIAATPRGVRLSIGACIRCFGQMPARERGARPLRFRLLPAPAMVPWYFSFRISPGARQRLGDAFTSLWERHGMASGYVWSQELYDSVEGRRAGWPAVCYLYDAQQSSRPDHSASCVGRVRWLGHGVQLEDNPDGRGEAFEPVDVVALSREEFRAQ